MRDSVTRVLLIEDSPGDARLIKEMLFDVRGTKFQLHCCSRLNEGIKTAAKNPIDIVLLDLSLPDSHGLDTFTSFKLQVPDLPVIVLTGLDDEAVALRAVQAGAQDYLVKGRVDDMLLGSAIRYSIERHRLRAELQALSLGDELTGLYNRRGFETLAQQQIKMAKRAKKELTLLFMDVDGLKEVNDNLGHHVGDRMLSDTAHILNGTFRDTDIKARLGGDEFVVLSMESFETVKKKLVTRLQKNLLKQNQRSDDYHLSLSIGMAHYDPESSATLEELVAQADKLMYQHKQHKESPQQHNAEHIG